MRHSVSIALLLLVQNVICMPQSLVVTTTTTTEKIQEKSEDKSQDAKEVEEQSPYIAKLHIRSDIEFRYSKTVVTSLIKNPSSEPQEIDFELLLPQKAFISNFTIEDNDKVYVSKVEEKKTAQETYDNAVSQGQSAAIVDAREENLFGVKANIGPTEKLVFKLTYEEILERHVGKYEHSIHVNPKQIVKDVKIDVFINETLPVINVNVPTIKTSVNDIVSQLDDNEVVVINGENSNQVHIEYKPSTEEQLKISKLNGVTGHFIVQYDVDRQGQDNEIQVVDGYFVHFFAPQDLKLLQKHIVFVLDISGSMSGEKIQQLKDSMVTILDDLKDNDFFSILTFSNGVNHWGPANDEVEAVKPLFYPGNNFLKREAIGHVLELSAGGGTNIYDSLTEAVEVVKAGIQSEVMGKDVTPAIIFLTDGQPSASITNTKEIRKHLSNINTDLRVPVYGLAFGRGADFNFIRKMSQENFAFARKIYEGADAAIQLEDFYAEVSSPLLTNVTFDYVGDNFQEQTTNTKPGARFYKGGEIPHVGKLVQDPENLNWNSEIVLTATSAGGEYKKIIRHCVLPKPMPSDSYYHQSIYNLTLIEPLYPCIPFPPHPPIPEQPHKSNIIERMWAFMSIKNLLKEETKEDENLEGKDKALELALKYNFVTDLTSLVVVKPKDKDSNSTDAIVDLQAADDSSRQLFLSYSPKLAYKPQSYGTPYGASNYGSPAAAPLPNLRLGSGVLMGGSSVTSYGASNYGSPAMAPLPNIRGGLPTAKSRRPQLSTRAPFYTTTSPFTRAPFYGYADYDQEEEEEATTCPPPDSCKIIFYSKTYFRGSEATLTESVMDFTTDPLSSKVTSFKIEGNCKWELHTEKDGGGHKEHFSPGQYKSAVTLGKYLFRNVKSVTLLKGC